MELPISLKDNKFISKNIYNFINENINTFKRVYFKNGNDVININGLDITDELERAKELYYRVLKLTNFPREKPIKCYIYLTPFKKEIEPTIKNITCENCNSGSSTFYKDYVEILVWREEEWEKVFYHELIHGFYIDKKIVSSDVFADLKIYNSFKHYNSSILEAYTEILATMLYLEDCVSSTRPYRKLLKDHNIFLGTQVNKIIQHMTSTISNRSNRNHLESIRAFFRNPKNILDTTTNTSSYYILKSIYIWNSIYKDSKLLDNRVLLDIKFINSHFYRIFIDTLENEEYFNWLNKIYIEPKNNSLLLTLPDFLLK